MAQSNKFRSGRHFLHIPGPSNVPDRVLRAIDRAIIDHRGPGFAEMTLGVIDGMKGVFGTAGPVVIFPSSGTGAWEAALVNTLSPGDRVHRLSSEAAWTAIIPECYMAKAEEQFGPANCEIEGAESQ